MDLASLATPIAAACAIAALATSCGSGEVDAVIRQLDKRELTVEARGKERAWHFSYLNQRVITGELVIPVDTDVVVQLRSDDYLYVFSCPELGQKEIAVPELEYSISFRVNQPGEFELAMDPMCGFSLPPGQSMGILRVVSEDDFRAWMK